jgi:hypothetical protein
MMVAAGRFTVGGLLLGLASSLAAQQVVAPIESAPLVVLVPPAAPGVTPSAGPIVIPALTPVTLKVDDAITSKTARRGDRFSLTMIADIIVDGIVVVPRGARGEGEVVHAAGVGFGGRAGELIVAARFLEVGSERLPLQSFRIFKAGANNSAEAIGLMAAAGVVGAVAAMFVTGTSAEIGAGQFAMAKTTRAFTLPPPAAAPISTEGTKSK